MQSANQPSIQTVLPQHHTVQCQLCLLSIMRPETKYHLSCFLLITWVETKRKRVHRVGECIHSAGSTTHTVFDHQGGCCTADSVTCCSSTMDVQIPIRELLSTAGCKQINVRLKYQISIELRIVLSTTSQR